MILFSPIAGRQQTAPPQQRRSKDATASTPAPGPPRPPTPRPSPIDDVFRSVILVTLKSSKGYVFHQQQRYELGFTQTSPKNMRLSLRIYRECFDNTNDLQRNCYTQTKRAN
jgi:hypothetical protein